MFIHNNQVYDTLSEDVGGHMLDCGCGQLPDGQLVIFNPNCPHEHGKIIQLELFEL